MTIFSNLATYTIEPEEQRRVVAFENGAPVWDTYTQYNILLNGERVTFCFDEELVEETIRWFEEGDRIDPRYFTGLTAG